MKNCMFCEEEMLFLPVMCSEQHGDTFFFFFFTMIKSDLQDENASFVIFYYFSILEEIKTTERINLHQ